MKSQITLDEIASELKAKIIHRGDFEVVKGIVASSLMSDVLTTDEEEVLLVSNLTSSQTIRTADMVGAHAVLITNGKPLSDDMVDLAKELSISLLSTKHTLFSACYLLGRLIYG